MTLDDRDEALPPPPLLAAGAQLTGKCLRWAALASAALAAATALGTRWPEAAAFAELRRSGMAALTLGGLLLLLAALAGTRRVAQARLRAAATGSPPRTVGRTARWPQALLVTPAALAAAALVWQERPLAGLPLAPTQTCLALAAAAAALAFGLLVMERSLAASSDVGLPEAPGLRALAFIAAATSFAAGLLELAAALGLPWTDRVAGGLAFLLAAIGIELAGRALGRLFLPPPLPARARGAATSFIATVLDDAAHGRLRDTAPLRTQFGIDVSRSWALAYVRAASVPLLLVLGQVAWGLSGLALVDMDSREVYERLGAPVRVLHPGLHAILPWPLGATRRVEFGATHELPLGDAGPPAEAPGAAEDAPPASADRRWEQAHPGELTLLIASESGGRQNFQCVSADLRVLYRVGLTDADALRAAYAAAAPADLVRASAGNVVSAYFAGRTLTAVLGADREAMAEGLRRAVQAELDDNGSGIETLALVIEAIHPPAGAAEAYHGVRAAEIAARAAIFAEHGRAIAVHAQSRQYTTEQLAQARAVSAETVGGARSSLIRFTADREAAAAGGQSFLVERYFAAVTAAMAHAPMTILDHRLAGHDAAVLDLRSFGAAAAAVTDGE